MLEAPTIRPLCGEVLPMFHAPSRPSYMMLPLWCFMRISVIQRVGDRDKESWSVKDYAFTIPANPMSDRVQMIVMLYED